MPVWSTTALGVLSLIIGSAGEAGDEGPLPVLGSILDAAAAAEFRQSAGDGA